MKSFTKTLQSDSITLYEDCIRFDAVIEHDPIAIKCLDVITTIAENLTFVKEIVKVPSEMEDTLISE